MRAHRPETVRAIAGAVVLALAGFTWSGPSAAGHPGEGGSKEPGGGALVTALADWVTQAIEVAGVVVIVCGAVLATGLFLRDRLGGLGWGEAYERYRANLGRGILLGLELLVAADIISTVAAPLDLDSLAALGLVVLIRTFLSFSLEVEIKGRLPWRGDRAGRSEAGG